VPERLAEIDGLRIRYLDEGDGAPLILLHGASLGSSCDVWTEILSMLAARGLRAIAPDLPGFGGSDNPEDPSLGYRTRFVGAFMDALSLANARIVGHSQSGRIAVSLAMKAPARVSGIVVVGTASLLPPLPGAEKSGDGDEGGETEPSLDDCRALLESQLFDRSRATPERVAVRHRMSIGKNFAAFRARQAAKSAGKGEKRDAPAWQRLRDVTVPTRLVYGMQDRAARPRSAIAKELDPSLDLHLVDRCAHLAMWDAPETLSSLIAAPPTR
jgi:pimeloyl-ACP methyl ester carboxylesterase